MIFFFITFQHIYVDIKFMTCTAICCFIYFFLYGTMSFFRIIFNSVVDNVFNNLVAVQVG